MCACARAPGLPVLPERKCEKGPISVWARIPGCLRARTPVTGRQQHSGGGLRERPPGSASASASAASASAVPPQQSSRCRRPAAYASVATAQGAARGASALAGQTAASRVVAWCTARDGCVRAQCTPALAPAGMRGSLPAGRLRPCWVAVSRGLPEGKGVDWRRATRRSPMRSGWRGGAAIVLDGAGSRAQTPHRPVSDANQAARRVRCCGGAALVASLDIVCRRSWRKGSRCWALSGTAKAGMGIGW